MTTMRQLINVRWLLLAMALTPACGGASETTGGSGGSAGGGSGGEGGVMGRGDAAVGGSGGDVPMGGSGGSSGGDAGGSCPQLTNFTLAIHVVVDVSWPETLGTAAGNGKMHLWNLAKMTANGTTLSGMTQPCGSQLPELVLKALVGGGKTQLDVPHAVWDAPGAPRAPSTGTISGWNPGSMLTTMPTNVLVGLTMPDPNGPWPASYTMITAVDADGDGRGGITGVPKSGAGFVQPPVATPILGLGPKADKVYLVSRTAIGLTGTMTSCTEQSGTVNVKFFDNHIVGCHVAGAEECSPAQVEFIDMNRTKFTATSGTFTSKLVPDTATCADARAM